MALIFILCMMIYQSGYMRQAQQEILVGTSYSEKLAKNYKIKLPDEIKKPTDARFLSTNRDSYANDKTVNKISRIIEDFDSFADSVVDRYTKYYDELKYFDVEKLINEFKNGHANAEKLIAVYESVLSNGDINPSTYLYTKRHFIIAKIFIEKFEHITVNKINVENLKMDNEDKKNGFKLGVFIGLEPLFVTTIFSASGRDNASLSQAYGKLVDYYSHIVAKMYPEEYLKATQLDKHPLPQNTYLKFLKYLESERHDQILL